MAASWHGTPAGSRAAGPDRLGPPKLAGVEPAPVTADEVPAFLETVHSAYHHDLTPDNVANYRRVVEPARTLALRDGDRIVAGTAIYSRRLTIPGGEAPMAGVTQVGVLPTHRRRGLLTTLMRRQLADIHEDGREAVAGLGERGRAGAGS
jgi:predicted acetyltransferase